MARVGNWDLDVASGRLLWSDEVFRIFDLSPGEGSPTLDTFLQMVHPEDSERVRDALRAVCSVRHTVQLEHRLLLPSGAIKHVRVMALNVFEGDRSVHSKGTIQDITETRRAELALQQLNEELEKRVSERTREMAVLNRELDTFSYSVSHDLRTPLRAIDGFASLLAEQSDRLSDEGRVFLHKIQESTRRMGELITDLLSLAHHGRAPVRHEKVNLSELARGLAAELERGESTRQIEWAIEDDLLVEADPTLMRVVLQNLLGNACKYTGREPRARISLSRSEAADGLQTFCVRDNGAGFDMAYASQLFQPFKRLHGRNEFEGTGVGLATVQRVVQRHGGKVSAEGVVGQGAAFYFSLPKEAPEAAPQSTW
nr:ATP-binding protein [Hydrogenophaga aromaticivorans]